MYISIWCGTTASLVQETVNMPQHRKWSLVVRETEWLEAKTNAAVSMCRHTCKLVLFIELVKQLLLLQLLFLIGGVFLILVIFALFHPHQLAELVCDLAVLVLREWRATPCCHALLQPHTIIMLINITSKRQCKFHNSRTQHSIQHRTKWRWAHLALCDYDLILCFLSTQLVTLTFDFYQKLVISI